MKERPILFSAPMVRAILDGSKTQTRRIVKPEKVFSPYLPYTNARFDERGNYCFDSGPNVHNHIGLSDPNIAKQWCPYSLCDGYDEAPGRLWVRETHLPKVSGTIYRADFSEFEAAGLGGMYGGWKPSIFCKREYSRITLEIVSVRVERLQDISYEDALAEGVSDLTAMLRDECKPPDGESGNDCARRLHWPQRLYEQLWESINGAGSWDVNPWVWCIEFKVMKP